MAEETIRNSEAGQATGVYVKFSAEWKERVSRRWSTHMRCNAIMGGADRGGFTRDQK